MLRLDLLGVLKKVSPALATKPVVPIFDHLCFTGEHVFAYDDVVAMRASCKLDFKGALPGSLLLSMLGASAVDNVCFEVIDSEVQLKLGRAKLKLASLSPDDFLFRAPDYSTATKLVLDDKLIGALKIAARSASATLGDNSKLGITVVFGRKCLTLYATDGMTLVRCIVPVRSPDLDGQSVIMPERFYSLMLRMGAKELLLTDQGDLVALGNGLELFGRVIQGAKPEQYVAVLDRIQIDTVPSADVPPILYRCLERALLVNRDLVTLSYEAGRLHLLSEGNGSELRDSAKIDLGSEAIVVTTSAECVMRYLDAVNRVGISDRGVVLDGPSTVVLVAVQKSND